MHRVSETSKIIRERLKLHKCKNIPICMRRARIAVEINSARDLRAKFSRILRGLGLDVTTLSIFCLPDFNDPPLPRNSLITIYDFN